MGSPRSRIAAIAILACTALVVALGPPLHRAWSCIERVEGAERTEVVVLEVLDDALTVEVDRGPAAGELCTIHAFGKVEVGRSYPAYRLADGSGRCEFVATVENSRDLVRAIGASSFALLLLVVLGATVLARLAGAPARSTRRFDGPIPSCPRCAKPMEEGTLVPMAGVHWRSRGQAIGLPSVVGGLPGTVGWRGRPQLHAFRCEPCEVAVFRYGRG